ncbi:single-stranded DNA-binding protein [Candidatus Peregrinibacteria bacterium]|nr:single-stranded DNA-binding protein [Candidatus Peregrinibacteria bacterium]
MKSLNKVMLIGHLAADPELKQTKNGHTVVNFPVATNRVFRNGDGSKREIVDFHRVVAWNKLGEICGSYLFKGVAIYMEGRLANRSFEDSEGKKHYRTEIVADELNILTSKKNKSGNTEIGIENVSADIDAEVKIAHESEELVTA